MLACYSMFKYIRPTIATLGLFLVVLVLPIGALAQQVADQTTQDQTPVIQDVQGLRLQIAQHTQDPYTKEVRLDVIVYSQITSDRVQVVWTINGVSRLVSPDNGIATLSVVPNTYYVTSAIISPQGIGNTQIVARVQAFQADGAYISTASKNIASQANRDLFPSTPQYVAAQIALAVRGFAAFALIVIILIVLGYLIFLQFKKWLDRDN